ncbi:MAG: tRNA lysidine(34) synthetase TilS [Terracidiphilus sp.]
MPSSPKKPSATLPLDLSLLKPGMRVVVGLSGGADSVALLRILTARALELGLVVHAAHLHHGLRGAEADADLEFCRELATKLNVPFHEMRVDTAAAAEPDPKTGKPRETIEEAARRLRYSWFWQLLSEGLPHAVPAHAVVATAHTLDDQAETVLAKLLRGAWTEGLAGISPKLETAGAVRPLLGTRRSEVEAYLRELGQEWREDSTNRHLSFTRNRIRHELLPLLEGWNPRLREHLAQMADLARDEEAWWTAEVARLAPQILLPGRPVRGGGRAAGAGLALEASRLASLAPALQRRLLRYAAEQFGVALDFAATESLRSLALTGRAGQRLELPNGLRAERSAREVRLSPGLKSAPEDKTARAAPASGPSEYRATIPGEIQAPEFDVRLTIERCSHPGASDHADSQNGQSAQTAVLRNWRPGDRVRLRYSAGPRKVKEVLERMRVTGTSRALWPVLEVDGRILWMKGVEVEPDPGLIITAELSPGSDSKPAKSPANGSV